MLMALALAMKEMLMIGKVKKTYRVVDRRGAYHPKKKRASVVKKKPMMALATESKIDVLA